jgi:hypothetical protein
VKLDYWARRGSPGQSIAAKSHLRLVLLPFLLLLAGCFTSSQPKFPLSSAVAVFGDGGRYIAYERSSDGSFRRDETIELRKRADGGYDYIDEKGKVTPLSLYRIGPNLYVAQAIREDGQTADYVAVRVNGNEVLTYPLDCTKQDAAKLKSLGVEITDQGRVCNVDKVADPLTLLAGLNRGEPSGKMVRE